jgi:hypothetical protein
MRWMGCLGGALVITAAVAAHADPDPESQSERIEDCEGLPERGKLARLEPIGEDALHAVARSGEQYVVFPVAEGRGCEVFPIGRAEARATGAFGGGATKVCALRPPRCTAGSCFVALLARDKADRPTAALRTEVSCDESVALAAIKLFPGRDSVELTCRASAGAGWKERRVLADAAAGSAAGSIEALYSLGTGSYIAPSPDEKKAGKCPSRPVGSIRVEKVAEQPVLRVVDPAAGRLADGKGTLPARQLAWDGKRGEFVPTGAPDVPTKVDARACKR